MSRHTDDQDVQAMRDEFLLAGSPLGDDEYLAQMFATLRDVRDLEATPRPSPTLTMVLERGTGAHRAVHSPSLRRVLAQRFARAGLTLKVMVGAGLVGAGVAAAGGLGAVPGGSFIQDGLDAVSPSGDGPLGANQIVDAHESIMGVPASGPTLVPTVIGPPAPAEVTPAAVTSGESTGGLLAAEPGTTVVLSPGRPTTAPGAPWNDVIENSPSSGHGNAGDGNGNHGGGVDGVPGGYAGGGSGHAGGGNAGSDNADADHGNSDAGGNRAEHANVGGNATDAANSGGKGRG